MDALGAGRKAGACVGQTARARSGRRFARLNAAERGVILCGPRAMSDGLADRVLRPQPRDGLSGAHGGGIPSALDAKSSRKGISFSTTSCLRVPGFARRGPST